MFGALCRSVINNAPKCYYKYIKLLRLGNFHFVNRKKMSASSNFTNDFTYVAFPDKPTYLTKWQSNVSSEFPENVSDVINTGQYNIFVIHPEISEEDPLLRYMKTGIIAQKVIRKLPDFRGGFALCVSSTPRGLQRGVCVYINKDDDALTEIKHIAKEHGIDFYFRFLNRKNGKFTRVSYGVEDGEHPSQVVEEVQFSLCKPFTESVLFSTPIYTPVFHDYSRTRMILKQNSDMPEVRELLNIADQLIPQEFSVKDLQENIQHPFVVVEGMDATGKTTLTTILEDRLSAVRYYTPPPAIENLRKFFDSLPELIRRAYYSVGNYIVAMEISKECKERAVIMDRFWHSTAAYGIANESSSGDLPFHGHSVYQWPADLIKPSAVLFLTVSEEIRKKRLQGRNVEITFEEKNLDKDKLFRKRLCDSYRRMENPHLVEIDASGTVEEVVASAIEKLVNCGIHITNTDTCK